MTAFERDLALSRAPPSRTATFPKLRLLTMSFVLEKKEEYRELGAIMRPTQ